MSLYAGYSTDKSLETKGVWLDYPHASGVSSFLIARGGGANTRFATAIAAALKPFQVLLDRKLPLPEEAANEALIRAYADAVVLDWQGVTDQDGKSLPFTKENVIKVLTDLPVIFADIRDQAQNISNYQAEAVQSAEKNSPNT